MNVLLIWVNGLFQKAVETDCFFFCALDKPIPLKVLYTYTPYGIERRASMKVFMEKLEHLLEIGGIKKDIAFLAISGFWHWKRWSIIRITI